MLAKVGKPAPDFETSAYANGDIIKLKLSSYKGKWVVLYFYPADFTFVCPTELTAVARRYEELKELEVEVLSISTDTPFTHKAWQDHELSQMIPGGLPYPMLSDPGGRIGTMYGVYDDDSGLNLRGRFLIDPDGIIQSAEILSAPVGRQVKEMIRQIKAFRLVRESGEATPAGWEPGEKTLIPSTELIGKVCEIWGNPEK